MLSMGGKSEEWFCTLCTGMKEEEEKRFDETCQILMADIWGCLRNSTIARNNLVEASHQYQVHTYMQGSINESNFGKNYGRNANRAQKPTCCLHFMPASIPISVT
jgi:hypothetical protein